MGHIGLTPQAISVIGGFRAQGRTASRARKLIDEALRLQDAGAFAIALASRDIDKLHSVWAKNVNTSYYARHKETGV